MVSEEWVRDSTSGNSFSRSISQLTCITECLGQFSTSGRSAFYKSSYNNVYPQVPPAPANSQPDGHREDIGTNLLG